MSFYYLFLFVIILEYLWDSVLNVWNVFYSTKVSKIPDILSDKISPEDFEKSKKYLKDTTRVKIIKIYINLFINLWFIIWGFPYFEKFVSNLTDSLILQSLLFFGIYWIIHSLITLPIKAYSIFVIENKYGFNTMSGKTFVLDIIRNIIITIIFFAPLISLLIWFLNLEQNWWWKVSLAFIAFQLFISWAYPIFFAPLFNKFTPLDDENLRKKINKLLEKANFKVSKIFIMDASKRTRKQDAYLTGIGKSRRLVLFDTILNYSPEEILAVIAHELGHNVKKHIPKLLISFSIFYTFMFYLTNLVYNFLQNNNIFGVNSVYATFTYAFLFIASILYFATPIINYFQRKFEYDADSFSAKLLGTPEHLISALKRLVKENLLNVTPLPIYKIWYYSHPSPEERLKKLRQD
ncbi:M48 family metallopeptidase [Thermosipho ferrireducens]|uniref:M48 family metallopeptidase n=1 Tax=Thermosipho ferrireducens TaxID=2571116 RepID=A0ABX7S763_9BACT|nr:M48 family metallopeptidase [Thermosipho ferrireducens]QTA38419.1 M48 family metallopeptidase [Thermosipho ferrireducens]